MLHRSNFHNVRGSLLAISLITSLIVGCGDGTSSGGPAKANAPTTPVHTMIIDAGSSGTRLSFYRVTEEAGGYPQITLLFDQKFRDNGINDFLSNAGTIAPEKWPKDYKPAGCRMDEKTQNGGETDVGPCVILPLLDSMKDTMTKAGVTANQVKVELFATAGMRTMSKTNGGAYTEEQIKAFYDTIKSFVKAQNFDVGDFRTSNGNKEEGIWTWANLNDQYYNAFGGNTKYHTGAPEVRGDFEVGGSSMQIAFPTTSIPLGDANNVYKVSINGKSYNVFSKTYLGLGADDARKFTRAYGYNSANSADYTGLDCFGKNATATNTVEDSGVALFNAPNIFPNSKTPVGNATGQVWDPVLSNTGAGTPLVLKAAGKYNFKTCTKKYDDVTKTVMTLPRNNNGTNNEGAASSYADLVSKVAQSSAPFVGIDGFYWVAKDLKLTDDAKAKNPVNEAKISSGIATVCPDGGEGPTGKKLDALRVCPDAAYMYNFLWQKNTADEPGLFGPGSKATYEGVLPNKFNNETVLTWTRGYLLVKYGK